jgi:hypothetical protein
MAEEDLMCKAAQLDERILLPVTKITMTVTAEVEITVPSIDFDVKKIKTQLHDQRWKWLRGVKLDKRVLAETLGMESTTFLEIEDGFGVIQWPTNYAVRYDTQGNVINEK